MDRPTIEDEAARLLLEQRWAALALSGPDGPAASMVAYAVEPAMAGLLVFVSSLAAHTRLLAATGTAALAIGAPDLGAGDPQQLARLTLTATAAPLEREDADFAAAWPVYAERFPAAVPRLALADFALFRLSPTAAHFVGGFARAASVDPGRLAAAVATLQER